MSALELFTTEWRELWGDNLPESVGAVYTRPEVVELILDLSGYSLGGDRLVKQSVLEPSCGDGAFLEVIVQRLIDSETEHCGEADWYDELLEQAICASDINLPSIRTAQRRITDRLITAGCPTDRAKELADAWTMHADFLLHDWNRQFSLVVGNPPYVRLEALPKAVLAAYRARFATATDRADLYIPFFERGLELLSSDGALAFICANRFAKNQYGAALRKLLAERYHVRHFINLEHTQPFVQSVSAYPAIFVVDHDRGAPTSAADLADCEPTTLTQLSHEVLGKGSGGSLVTVFPSWYPDGGPWQSTCLPTQRFLARLAESFPELEQSGPGTKVGIGVATGADDVFVLPSMSAEIEASRQLPLVMAQDIGVRAINWSGRYLLNPFCDGNDGSLASLAEYPGMAGHLAVHEGRLRGRHVARSRPHAWYRTIDRVWPDLTGTPKLVIPDIQAGGVVGVDRGDYYPHHNVYWVVSESWPLATLQALLRSSFVLVQVKAFSVQMRGRSLRYQAGTLRRLRIPSFASLSSRQLEELAAVGNSHDQAAIDAAASDAYGIAISELFRVVEKVM